MTTQQEQLVADRIDYLIGIGDDVDYTHKQVFYTLDTNEAKYLSSLSLLKSLFVI